MDGPEGAAAVMDQETRCQHCDFINLTEAELCISCAQELPKVDTKKYRLCRRPTVACKFCTSIIQEDSRICPVCSKSQDFLVEGEQKKIAEENPKYLPRRTGTMACKYCTSIIKQDCRICPICSKSQDLTADGARPEETDDWLTDDEDACENCTFRSKSSTCEMCGNVLRLHSAYVEHNCMPGRDLVPTQPNLPDAALDGEQTQGFVDWALSFTEKICEDSLIFVTMPLGYPCYK